MHPVRYLMRELDTHLLELGSFEARDVLALREDTGDAADIRPRSARSSGVRRPSATDVADADPPARL
jgi:hypothetical protein